MIKFKPTISVRTKYFTINKYIQSVSVNKAKKLRFPTIRGTLLPSWDWQCGGGIAINWLYGRVRFIPRKQKYGIKHWRNIK